MTTPELIKNDAECVAHTCKGLFFSADYLVCTYNICIFVSFFFGLIGLGFDNLGIYSKILGCISLFLCVILLKYDLSFKKVDGYYHLANEYLSIYKELQKMFYSNDYSQYDYVHYEINKLNLKTAQYPILLFGRKWASTKRVTEQMGCHWIYSDNNTS